MKRLSVVLVAVAIGIVVVGATQVLQKSLKELVNDSDHVVIGKVFKVDMVDGAGKEVSDLEARTGPGLETQIRLHVSVEKDGWLRTSKTNPPTSLTIPLWQMWHYSLGHIKEATEGQTSIFLLSGENYRTVYPAGFQRPISEKRKILSLWKKKQRR
jgi:hypothetical protein